MPTRGSGFLRNRLALLGIAPKPDRDCSWMVSRTEGDLDAGLARLVMGSASVVSEATEEEVTEPRECAAVAFDTTT